MTPVRVAIVDDDALVRGGLATIIDLEPDLTIVGEGADGLDVDALVADSAPDVLLMDVRMPRLDGIAASLGGKRRYGGVQKAIADYKLRGEQLFFPNAGQEGRDATDDASEITHVLPPVCRPLSPPEASSPYRGNADDVRNRCGQTIHRNHYREAADLIIKGLNGAIGKKRVTYDFERLMEGATLVKCSQFGDEIISSM